jgi:hypothetical protein
MYMYSSLCTADCQTDLTNLKTNIVSSCPDLSFSLGGSQFTADRIMDFWISKYSLTCLTDGSSCVFVGTAAVVRRLSKHSHLADVYLQVLPGLGK